MKRKLPEEIVVPLAVVIIAFTGLLFVWLFCWSIEKLPWPDVDSADDKRAEYYKDVSDRLIEENHKLRMGQIR